MPPSRIVVVAALLLGCGPRVVGGDSDGASGTGTGTGTGTAGRDLGVGPDVPVQPMPPPLPEYCGDATLRDAWVHIDGTDLDERDSLEGVGIIDGDLVIARAPDVDLSFLECIAEITGDLVLSDNDALVDVSGLAQVRRLGGNLVVARNDALVEFDALLWVTEIVRSENPDYPQGDLQVDHSVAFFENDALQWIRGLSSLVVVWGNLQIQNNPALVDIAGLRALRAVGGSFAVTHNRSLCLSHIDLIGAGIEQPSPPPPYWSTVANDEDC